MEDNLKSDLRYRTYNFSISVIRFVGDLPEKKLFWVILDQILRSSTSIGANIVEAKASSSRKEFIRYYQIALKSAHETNYWLSLLNDATEINKDKLHVIIKELDEIIRMLTSSILTLKNKF